MGIYPECVYTVVLMLMFSVMGVHQSVHGDGVKDIAFAVEDCRGLYKVSHAPSE